MTAAAAGAAGIAGACVGRPGLTRRRLLLTSGAAVAAVSLGEGAQLLGRLASPASPGLRRSEWLPYIGHRFRLTAPDTGTLIAPLTAVAQTDSTRLAASEDAFILIFHAPQGEHRLGQAVMEVQHPAGWSVRLLVAPAGPGHRGLDYAAVINRVTPASRRTDGK